MQYLHACFKNLALDFEILAGVAGGFEARENREDCLFSPLYPRGDSRSIDYFLPLIKLFKTIDCISRINIF